MTQGKLEKALQNLRLRPVLLGCVLGLPLTVVILVVLKNWPTVGWVTVGIWIILGHFWLNRPLVKTIWVASFVGMILALIICTTFMWG
jgi:hypothetical protein